MKKFPELIHEKIVHARGEAAFFLGGPLEQQRGQNAVASVEQHDVDRDGERRNYRESWLDTLQETRQYRKDRTQRHKGAEGETFAYKYGCALAKASRALVTELENALAEVQKKAEMLETRVGQRNAASDVNDVSF